MIALVFLLLGSWWLWKKQFFLDRKFNSTALGIAFVVKVLGACALIALYTYYYSDTTKSDIHKYMRDAGVLVSHAYENPLSYFKILFGCYQESASTNDVFSQMLYWEKPNTYGLWNENQVIIRLDSVLYLLGGGSLFLATMVLVFISFCSQIFLFRQILQNDYGHPKLLYLLIFYSPSLLIWSGGLLKEAWVVIFLNLFIATLFSARRIQLLLLSLFGFVLLLIKPIVGAVLVLSMFVYFMFEMLRFRRFLYATIVLSAVALIGLKINNDLTAIEYPKGKYEQVDFDQESVSYRNNVLGTGWNILEKLKFYQLGRRVEAKREGAKSYIHIPELDGTWFNFVWTFPFGIVTTCFRPLIWESSSPLIGLAALENVFYLVLFVYWFRSGWRNTLTRNPVAMFCLVFFLLMGAFIGMVIPVLGNLVRYKVIIYPAFLLLISQIDIGLLPARLQRLLK